MFSSGICKVYKYSPQNLAKALSNDFLNDAEIKKNGIHYEYFTDYFTSKPKGLGAKQIVIENQYVSKSYINDYSSYYSLCFKDYSRFCKRIHFFSIEFTKKEFENAIFENKHPQILRNYLGYIVVRPLPEFYIGATILKPYGNVVGKKRNYPVCKKYKINLFGKGIELSALAYQSQDKVISACATASLWSAFQKTSELFNTKIPTPSEITIAGDNSDESTARTFPNSGLTISQIKNVIDSMGIVAELVNKHAFLSKNNNVKTLIYGYSKIGVPCCLVFELIDDGGLEKGTHLVTITGFRLKNKITFPDDMNCNILAHQIETFYAHDDRIGPYSRLGFVEKRGHENLETAWYDPKNKKKKITADLYTFIGLIEKKIRIRYIEVHKTIGCLNLLFKSIGILDKKFIWDIHLDYSNNFKKEIISLKKLSVDYKKKITIYNFPKFIWRAKLLSKKGIELEFIFDATDIASACYLIGIVYYNSTLKSGLGEHFNEFGGYYKTELFLKEKEELGREFYEKFYSSLNNEDFFQQS